MGHNHHFTLFFCSDLRVPHKCSVKRDWFCVAGKVQHRKSRVETPQAFNNGGTFIWTLESVTSGCCRMRLPHHEGFPENCAETPKQLGGRFLQDMGFPV